MSAIWGIFRFDGAGVADRDIDRMGASMAVRCGDGSARFLDGPIGLGHGLMRVTREDAFDQQPLYDRDAGLVIVADCRIDNREDLAASLDIAPATLATMPDSALVLHAYRRWGDACPARLIGDFAIAIWDVARKRLLLTRDPMGQRPLHYYLGDGFVAFATDVAALWAAPGVPRTLDESWLGHFANHWRVPRGGRTALAGISGLCGGTTMEIAADGTVVETRYWAPHADPAHLGHADAYYVTTYRKILEEAVACRVRRLVDPPGLSLSGGFDSSAIAALAGPALRDGGKLVTVTSAMPERVGGWPRDPRPWVERCARDMSHLDVSYIDFYDEDPLRGLDAQLAANAGLPVTTMASLDAEFYAVLKAAGVRSAMDGLGGDQTLNPRGDMTLAHLAVRGRISTLRREIVAHRRVTGESWPGILIRRIALPLLPKPLRALVDAAGRGFRRKEPLLLFQDAFVARLVCAGTILPAPRLAAPRAEHNMRATMRDLLTRLSMQAPALETVAAAHGLDLTRPFFDKRVVEFALAVPQHLDVRGGRNRYLACTALADVLPPEFQQRSRSNDGTIADPLSVDDAPLRAAVAHLATTSINDYFDFAEVEKLLDRAADPRRGDRAAREYALREAIRTIVFARYVAWVEPRNS